MRPFREAHRFFFAKGRHRQLFVEISNRVLLARREVCQLPVAPLEATLARTASTVRSLNRSRFL